MLKNGSHLRRREISQRTGLSLFEILAAVFVLMVGLLGVLAVIPFGMYQMARVNKADFGGNCGRAALQEIKIRKWAFDYDTSLYPGTALRSMIRHIDNNGDRYLYCGRPIIVDPLMMETNNFNSNFNYFPYNQTSGLPRISCEMRHPKDQGVLRKDSTATVSVNEYTWLAQDLFTWSDEKNFAPAGKPIVNNPRPVGITDSTRGYDAIQSKDNFTWLYMLTPNVRGQYINNNNLLYAKESDVSGYDVDVVVFFDRKFNPADADEFERLVDARQDGTGYRGGEFTIESANEEDLDMTDTRWVLLSCPQRTGQPLFAKWYRVISSGDAPKPIDTQKGDIPIDPDNGLYQRELMLMGPDLPDDPTNINITLVKGAIHVYSGVAVK